MSRRPVLIDPVTAARLARNEIPFEIPTGLEGCAVEDSREQDDEIVGALELRALRLADSWAGPLRGVPSTSSQGSTRS